MEPAATALPPDLDRDIALLIAIWVTIHGGDPEPVDVGLATSLGAGALVARLRSQVKALADPLPDNRLAERLRELDLAVTFSNGFVCVKGPDGEPGCCVRQAVFHR